MIKSSFIFALECSGEVGKVICFDFVDLSVLEGVVL